MDLPATFVCESDDGFSSWSINGILLETLPPEIEEDIVVSETNTLQGTRVEELTIPARAEYNGTRVQCLVFTVDGPRAESGNATLVIQGNFFKSDAICIVRFFLGPLSAATGLTATHNATSITISWEAPWSLDVTGVDHDIWYSVLIQNVTDENNPTPISCTDCTNITETVYTFTPDHLSPCHVYKFSVTPFNGAGQGEGSNYYSTLHDLSCTFDLSLISLMTIFLHVDLPISEVNVSVTEKSKDRYQVSLTVPANNTGV